MRGLRVCEVWEKLCFFLLLASAMALRKSRTTYCDHNLRCDASPHGDPAPNRCTDAFCPLCGLAAAVSLEHLLQSRALWYRVPCKETDRPTPAKGLQPLQGASCRRPK